MNVRDQLAHYKLTPEHVLDLAAAIAAENFRRECVDPIEDPAATRALFEPFLAGRSEECFAVAFLDTRHRLIKLEILFRGTIDGAAVYPRVVAARALRYGAAAVIFAHNHPSGSGEPSLADRAITRRLSDGLALFDIRVLDHFIVGAGEPVSMALRGMIEGHLGHGPGFSEEEIAANKARRAKQSAAMKKSWATRKAKAEAA